MVSLLGFSAVRRPTQARRNARSKTGASIGRMIDSNSPQDVSGAPVSLSNARAAEGVDAACGKPCAFGQAPTAAPAADARRFGGIARLYGEDAASRLTQSRVVVVGIGGVGSWVAEALARSGVGALRLIDLDVIAESNINRQVHAIEPELGRAKVEAMAARIGLIAPACRVEAVDTFLDADNCARLVEGADAVIDCIDDVKAKTALIAHCVRQSLPLVVCGGAGGKRDATRLRRDDLALVRNDPLLAKVRARLRKDYGFPAGVAKGKPKRLRVDCVYIDEAPAPAPTTCAPGAALACAGYGSAMHMTASLGLMAVGLVLERMSQDGVGS